LLSPQVLGVDCKLGANEAAEPAVDAGLLFALGDYRVVVAFRVDAGGLFQDVLRAKFDAELAAFAAVRNGVDLTAREDLPVQIKRAASR